MIQLTATMIGLIASLVILVVALAVIAIDRKRLKSRLGQLEGRLTALSLDLDAARSTLQMTRRSVGSGTTEPTTGLVDGADPDNGFPDRWSPIVRRSPKA